MKTALLVAILALPVYAFAQNKRPMSSSQYPTLNLTKNVKDRMNDFEVHTSGMYFAKNQEQLFKHQMLKQSSLKPIIDSVYHWNLSGGVWYKISKTVDADYDDNNNMISSVDQTWNGIKWVNNIRNIRTYDANNNLASFSSQIWNGSNWVNQIIYNWTYDANNNLTLYTLQDGVNNMRIIYTFNENRNMTSELDQVGKDNDWVNTYLFTLTYDENNNHESYLGQTWNNNAWVNSLLDTYTYDANNNMTSSIEQSWINNMWVNSVKFIMLTYDAGNNLTDHIEQTWKENSWENSYQVFATYDANNNTTSSLLQAWEGSDWVTSGRETYNFTYDDNNVIKSMSHKSWNNTDIDPNMGDSTYYYYHIMLTGINELVRQGENINIYPNPGNGKFSINSNSTITALEVYNLLGDRIYSDFKPEQQTPKKVDLSNFPKGIYFIKIFTGNEKQIRKILLQ